MTVLSSDMVFGVGLGCLVQMLKTHSNVQVISQNMLPGVARGSSVVVSAAVFVPKRFNVTFCLPFASPQFEVEGLLMWILTGSLGLSLVLSFITVPLNRFYMTRAYGVFLLIFYFTFLLIALLTEFGKIHVA